MEAAPTTTSTKSSSSFFLKQEIRSNQGPATCRAIAIPTRLVDYQGLRIIPIYWNILMQHNYHIISSAYRWVFPSFTYTCPLDSDSLWKSLSFSGSDKCVEIRDDWSCSKESSLISVHGIGIYLPCTTYQYGQTCISVGVRVKTLDVLVLVQLWESVFVSFCRSF